MVAVIMLVPVLRTDLVLVFRQGRCLQLVSGYALLYGVSGPIV
jgi:hypothetical protein